MDEPTDFSLRIQGLNRQEYDSMSPEGRLVISQRSRRIAGFYNITLTAELLNAIIDQDESSRQYIAETLEGRHPDFEERVRSVVREYRQAKVDSSIKDYYKIKYGGQGIFSKEAESAKKDAEDLIAEPATKAKEDVVAEPATKAKEDVVAEPATKAKEDVVGEPAQVQSRPPQSEVSSSQPVSPKIPESPAVLSPEQRRRNIAQIMSKTQGSEVESVMRTEKDVIESILNITDENKGLGLTDEGVLKACESLIGRDESIHYIMEALMPANRPRLLDLAKQDTRQD